MKILTFILIMGSILITSNNGYSSDANQDPGTAMTKASEVKIYCLPGLSELPMTLVTEYSKRVNPENEIALFSTTEELSDATVCIFSNADPVAEHVYLPGKIVIGHEIIVPVVNTANPYLETLLQKGLSAHDFNYLLSAGASWNGLTGIESEHPLHVYISENDRIDSKLAQFGGINEATMAATVLPTAGELITQIRQDVYAIGFCRLSHAVKNGQNVFAEQVMVLPVDKNGNGKIDRFEQIYSSPDELVRGVWIGKYPRQLSRKIFAAPVVAEYDEATTAFLEWVIDDGQHSVTSLGYSNLLTREKTAALQALRPVSQPAQSPAIPRSPLIWLIASVLAFLLLLAVMIAGRRKKQHAAIERNEIPSIPALNRENIVAPAGLFYDKSHTWAFMEKNGVVKIGIDDFLQHVTGQLTQVRLKQPGERIRKGEKVVTIIQEGKQLHIYSPVTGKIKNHNQTLTDDPCQINTDPYNSGWIYQVEPSNWLRETKFMFMSDKFLDWLEDELIRLKDFVAISASKNEVLHNHIVLQDGGELTTPVLSELSPEVWEDFQTQFLDVSR